MQYFLWAYLVDQIMTSRYVVSKIMMYDVSLQKIEIFFCNEGIVSQQ